MFYRITIVLALCTLIAACSKSQDQERTQGVVESQAVVTGPVKVEAPDGVEIAATVHSTGQPVVVLVHGWMCDQTYWEAQVPALSEHFGVVTVDLAGSDSRLHDCSRGLSMASLASIPFRMLTLSGILKKLAVC